MKTMMVIGIGRFGKHLATMLADLGNDVMVIDKEEEVVNDLMSKVTMGQIGDCMHEDMIRSLGVDNFDCCFVCISSNFQASLEITSLLKEFGAKHVVSIAHRDIHAKFLLRNGADEIIYPEREAAHRAALKHSAKKVFDYIELTPEFSIFEMDTPQAWMGKSIRQVNVRSKYNLNIIGIKRSGSIIPVPGADYIFAEAEHLIVAGNAKTSSRLLDLR